LDLDKVREIQASLSTGGTVDVRPAEESTGLNITHPPHLNSPKSPRIAKTRTSRKPLINKAKLSDEARESVELLRRGTSENVSSAENKAAGEVMHVDLTKKLSAGEVRPITAAEKMLKREVAREKKIAAQRNKQVGISKNINISDGSENNSETVTNEAKTETAPSEKSKEEKEKGLLGQKPGVNITFALSKKQQEALHHPAKFLMYGGAKGGGKSWFMCVWIFLMAMKYRGNKLFFCRRRSVDFTNTTLETWKKVIPANLYRIHEQKKKIFIIPSGSVIDYGGLDDPLLIQSLNSSEFAHIGVDQAEEIEMDSFAMLRGTLRHRLPDGVYPPYQIRLTANPAQCWLKDYFILNPERDTAYIAALPTDNPGLPKDYVENLQQAFKHRPHLLQAYLHGSWDDLSGNDTCIRGTWIEEAKRKKVSAAVVKRVVVNDPAITGDENVCFLMEKAGNVYYKADELVIEHKRPFETAAMLAAYRKKHGAQIIALDVIGIGQGVVDGLNQLEEPILAINSCAKPTSHNAAVKYSNLRAQMWWEASEKFAESNVALPSDDFELARQLGVVRFDPTGTGKLLVQDKGEIKKAIGRSPDRADAFIMGLYALDYVNRLDNAEYQEVTRDRAGYGILIEPSHDEMYVGVGDDYSGYNL
jgi:phage terminase large subunit